MVDVDIDIGESSMSSIMSSDDGEQKVCGEGGESDESDETTSLLKEHHHHQPCRIHVHAHDATDISTRTRTAGTGTGSGMNTNNSNVKVQKVVRFKLPPTTATSTSTTTTTSTEGTAEDNTYNTYTLCDRDVLLSSLSRTYPRHRQTQGNGIDSSSNGSCYNILHQDFNHIQDKLTTVTPPSDTSSTNISTSTSTHTNTNKNDSNQKHPLTGLTYRALLVALFAIILVSNTWWHRHIKHLQIISSPPDPYYFWNLLYNNNNSSNGNNHRSSQSQHYLRNIIPSASDFMLSSSPKSQGISISESGSSSSSSSSSTNNGNGNGASSSSSSRSYTPPTIDKFSSYSTSKLVIAGKMTVLDGYCNIAELSLASGEWSLKERIQLSLYNSYSGGEVYSLLVNHTFNRDSFSFFDGNNAGKLNINGLNIEDKAKNGGSRGVHGGELIVVGAFDTTDRNSQTTYCSVGAWDGTELSKVGEGLCNSALSKGMKITSAALAGPDDVYVAGSFSTQVWNGGRHEFVNIYNIAHYNAVDKVWLPLPIGQISCSWCKVTVLALAYDSKRNQLHVTGKFNAIDGHNIPSGLAIYDLDSGHLVAHPGGGLTMYNETQDGVGTALQLDEEAGVLYVMGSFERMGKGQLCFGLAAFEIDSERWTCLADAAHTVYPSGGGNMLLTPYGLMVAGRVTTSTTWPDSSRPYTIALLNATRVVIENETKSTSSKSKATPVTDTISSFGHEYTWSWLPGFDGHDEPLHSLANGFGDFDGTVFIAGDNLVAAWYYEEKTEVDKSPSGTSITKTILVPVTASLSSDKVQGAVMAIAQLKPENILPGSDHRVVGYTIAVYFVALGALLGMFIALACNKNINQTMMAFLFANAKEAQMNGISLDTLTYTSGTMGTPNMNDVYQRAMKVRCVPNPHFLQLIDPQDIILHRIIGEGTFGRVWSAKLNSSSVAVKEFVFAQAAVAGKSSQQGEIIEEIIGEAGMMAILRHPNVLQLFGCSLTAQAIWIVCELCSLGSLRQLLDDEERELPLKFRLKIALQVAEGMMYLHNQDPPIIHRDLKSHNIMVHETFTETTNKTEDTKKTKDIKEIEEIRRFEQSMSENAKNAVLPYRIEHSDRTTKIESEATVVAKIGDWGSARATLSGSRSMTHGVGTACWLAPEVIKFARSSKFSDVYGYGIILWELATRDEVYAGLESTQIIANVANDNLRPPVPDSPLAHLMVKCWCENPEDRLTFKEIVKELNELISDIDTDASSNIKMSSDVTNDKTSFSQSSESYQNQIMEDTKITDTSNGQETVENS